MGKIENKLNVLEEILEKKKAPVLGHLNPGLSDYSIEKAYSEVNINEDIKALYKWRGGTKNLYDIQDSILEILPNGKFFSIPDSFRMYNLNIEYEVFENPGNFLPIFGSGESEMYLVKTDGTSTVYYVSPGSNIYCEPIFKSVLSMLDCIIECYLKEVFIVDQNEGLSTDFKEFYSLKEKYK